MSHLHFGGLKIKFMKLSLTQNELSDYVTSQCNAFFPDNNKVSKILLKPSLELALNRLEYCFKHICHPRYNKTEPFFDHLYSDHYLMFLWFLSNSTFEKTQSEKLSSKLYYLNKIMHGFDCLYDTKLPEVFIVFHGVGTMLGKAKYSNYFVCFQGCTVGSHKGNHPKMGVGFALTAHSSVIGNCLIGKRVTVATHTSLFEQNINDDSIFYSDKITGKPELRKSNACYAQQFFNTQF